MSTRDISYDARVAVTYDADRRDEEHWHKENDFIKHYFEDNKAGETILDIPIGTGRFLEFYPPAASVLGIDISPSMIELAQAKVPKAERRRVRLEVGDAKRLDSLENGSIDVIVCCRLFHLIQSHEREIILREFARLLRGDLVLQTYLRLPKRNWLVGIAVRVSRAAKSFLRNSGLTRRFETPWSHIKSYAFTEAELMRICNTVGLKLIHKTHLCLYNAEDVSIFVLRKQ